MNKDMKLLTDLQKYKDPLRTLKNVFNILHSPYKNVNIPFNPLFALKKLCSRKVSRHASPVLAGSMTVEAAIALPFFLMTILSFLSFIEIIQLQNSITMALRDAGMSMGIYGYVYDYTKKGGEADLTSVVPDVALTYGYAGTHVKKFLGEDYLDRIIKTYDAGSIHYYNSSVMEENDVVDLVATYSVRPRFNVVSLPEINLLCRYYGRAWTGYELEGRQTDSQSEQNVYITRDGSVYHLDRYCTHLNLTIVSCPTSEIDNQRNENGQMYRACSYCGNSEENGKYYITPQGDCYHKDLNCSGLKRTVDVVSITQVNGRSRCSRCGG